MAKNVLVKKRNPAALNGYDEIHPITKAGNVFASNGSSLEEMTALRDGYGVTTGSANTYAVPLNPGPPAYVAGLRITIQVNENSTAASTINVNGLGAKAIKRSNGNDVTNLKAGSVYTLVYNGSAFILQGEGGEGTAVSGDVRSGKTAVNATGDLITGTLPVQAGGTVTPGQSPQVKAAGIYDTAITVAGVTVPAANVLVGTTIAGTAGAMPNYTNNSYTAGGFTLNGSTIYLNPPAAGYYSGTSSINYTDSDLVAANIRSGVNIFGVTGNLAPRLYASGTSNTASNGSMYVSGLSFDPAIVYLYLFDVPTQSTYVFFSTSSGQWTWVRYAGTNPYGTVQGTGTATSPGGSWGSGSFNVNTLSGDRFCSWYAWK